MIKTITKVIIISTVAYFSIKKSVPLFLKEATGQVQISIIALVKAVYSLVFHCIITLLIIAIIDYFYQRYHYQKSLRMTPQELKQEQKELMGNPEIRSKIRQVQLHLSRQRMMKAVPTSDLILVNPTHYAIALKYSPELMHAPRVVAKGQLKIAQRIIALATKHNIPIIHRPEIARALFPVAIIGQEIPVEFYEIIAEILAEIYKKRGQHHTVLPSKQNGI